MRSKKKYQQPKPIAHIWDSTYDPDEDKPQPEPNTPQERENEGASSVATTTALSSPQAQQTTAKSTPRFRRAFTIEGEPSARKVRKPAKPAPITERLKAALANFLAAETLNGQPLLAKQARRLFLADPQTRAGYEGLHTALTRWGFLEANGQRGPTSRYSSTATGRDYAANQSLQSTLTEERIRKALDAGR